MSINPSLYQIAGTETRVEGAWKHVTYYIKGHHPQLLVGNMQNRYINGWSGPETEVHLKYLIPLKVFHVREWKKLS